MHCLISGTSVAEAMGYSTVEETLFMAAFGRPCAFAGSLTFLETFMENVTTAGKSAHTAREPKSKTASSGKRKRGGTQSAGGVSAVTKAKNRSNKQSLTAATARDKTDVSAPQNAVRTAAFVDRYTRAGTGRERQITMRLTEQTLETFERMERELGILATDLFRDGLWLATMVAERYHHREAGYELIMKRPDVDQPIDILARGSLYSVERYLRADISPSRETAHTSRLN